MVYTSIGYKSDLGKLAQYTKELNEYVNQIVKDYPDGIPLGVFYLHRNHLTDLNMKIDALISRIRGFSDNPFFETDGKYKGDK